MLLTHLPFSVSSAKNERKHVRKFIRTVKTVIPEAELNQKLVFKEAVKEFESICQSLTHFCCESCKMTGIAIKPSPKNIKVCTVCQASQESKEVKERESPIWYNKKGMVQYHLPKQL